MLLRLTLILLITCPLCGQDANPADRQDELTWAAKAGLPVATVHHLWRSMSHFADEKDDDSRSGLLDAKSLASRNQLLMVTAAGLPSCLTVAVFSKGPGNPNVWSESETTDKQGFCEHLGIEPEVNVANGKILVKVPGDLVSDKASHAEVVEYTYTWTGNTYFSSRKQTSLEFVPAANRMTKRPD